MRLFANDIAIDAASEGRELPVGSVIVGEIYKAKKDKDGKVIESSLGRRVRDKLMAVVVIEKGEGWGASFPDNLRNDDWDFAIFPLTVSACTRILMLAGRATPRWHRPNICSPWIISQGKSRA